MMQATNKFITMAVAAVVALGTLAQAQIAKLDSGPMNKDAADKTAPIQRQIPNVTDAIKPPSLSLSPAVVMTKGGYGQSVTQTMVLTNGTSRPMAFDMMAEDAIVRDGKRVFVPAGELPGSIAATAIFSKQSVV